MNAPIDVTNIRIETDRLLLRPWREADLNDFYEYASVPGVGEMAGWPHHTSLETSRTILDSFIQHKKTLALELKETGKVIGSLGLEELDPDLVEGELYGRELGFVLAKPYWGRGLMPEAVKAVVSYCFETLSYDYLTCGHFASNAQSRRVIEKCGFTYVKDSLYETQMDTQEVSKMYLLRNARKLAQSVTAPIDVTDIRIETDRLILRPWREDDLADYHEYARTPGLEKLTGWPPSGSLEESRRILGNLIRDKKSLAAEHRERGKVIGSISLEELEPDMLDGEGRGRELSFELSKPYWGQGLMPEAVKAVTGYCFGELDYDYLICGHYAANAQSQRVVEKCGFTYVKDVLVETLIGTQEVCKMYLLRNARKLAQSMTAPIDVTGIRIETDRLILRPWREADVFDFNEYARVDGVGQMAGWWPHQSLEESRTILNLFIGEKKTLALELKENGKVIGSIGLETREEDLGIAPGQKGREIGYVLNRDYWGKGYMPEAVKAVIDYCFRNLSYDFLTCGHFVKNDRSRRVVEKCGFTYLKDIVHHTRFGTEEPTKLYILYNIRRMNAPVDVSQARIETDRLLLRPLEPGDIQDYHAIVSCPEVAQFDGWTPSESLDESEKRLGEEIKGRETLAVVLKETGKLVGNFSIQRRDWTPYPIDRQLKGREFGFDLLPAYWGRGLMPEAVKAVTEWCFDTLHYDFVTCGYFLGNARSARVVEKCGFSFLFEGGHTMPSGVTEQIRTYIQYNPHKENVHV